MRSNARLAVVTSVLAVLWTLRAPAQQPTAGPTAAIEPAPVTLGVSFATPSAIFSRGMPPAFEYSVRNESAEEVKGTLALTIQELNGALIEEWTKPSPVAAGGVVRQQKQVVGIGAPGFYEVRLSYTMRGRGQQELTMTFGYAPDEILLTPTRAADFDAFWSRVGEELRRIPLAAEVVHVPDLSTRKVRLHKVSFQSVDDIRVSGWYAVPVAPGRHPAVLRLPGYGAARINPPLDLANLGYAAVAIQIRGSDVDALSYPAGNGRYMTLGVSSPEAYVYRQIVAHCLQAVSFLADRPEVDPQRIAVVGGSQGGGLTIMTTALDPRVRAAAADVPYLSAYPVSVPISRMPYQEIREHLIMHPTDAVQVRRTLSYFDTLNFADRIKAPILVSVGLRDRVCPPDSVFAVYNAIGSAVKQIKVYPLAEHEGGREVQAQFVREWLETHLGKGKS